MPTIPNIKDLVKRYGSVITINTENIKQNYKTIANHVAPARVSAVLKSNAYGIDISNILGILKAAGCSEYFVATIDEAIKARSICKGCNIYVLHGIFGNCEKLFLEHKVIPVINTLDQFNKWLNFAKSINHPLNCVLQFDSGFNRLGLRPEEVAIISENIAEYSKNINILYCISHLACSENGQHISNEKQYKAFQSMSDNFPNVKKSLAASYGVYLGRKYHFDLVRIGFALYGANPKPTHNNPLLPVIGYYTSVLETHNLQPGDSVGYGHIWSAPKLSTIATVNVGYADGILRECQNGHMFIEGYKVPIVGRISMDSCTIDITEVQHKVKIKEGTIVEIIGENQSIDQFSAMLNTIHCAAFNLLSIRYPKIYY